VDAKPLLWVATARDDIRALPATVRQELGTDLRRIQSGLPARDWKPMPTVGSGVNEIRVRVQGAYRLMYVAKFPEGIYVLHVFHRKAQKTSPLDLQLARTRYAAIRRGR